MPDWSLIFNVETGFDPYSLQLANGPKSLVQNNATTLEYQSANGDSSRAGEPFNTVAYAGISNRTFGALTVGRQDSLVLDNLSRYDAMGAAHAFSVIGDSSTVAGVGDTEDARYNTSLQYKVGTGPIRLAGSTNSAATTKAMPRIAPSRPKSGENSAAFRSMPSAARSRTPSRCRISANIPCPPGSESTT